MRRSNKGFTLAELLLAAAILAFALAGTLVLLSACILLNEGNRNLSVAVTHAQYAMEELKNSNFSSIPGYNDVSWVWDNSTKSWSGNSNPVNFQGLDAENINFTVGNVGTGAYDINITATWRDQGVRQRATTLRTLITER